MFVELRTRPGDPGRRMNPQTRPALVCGIEDTARARGHRMNPQTRPALVCGIEDPAGGLGPPHESADKARTCLRN